MTSQELENTSYLGVTQQVILNHLTKGTDSATDATDIDPMQDTGCHKTYMVAQCRCGAKYVKVISCGKEWCPTCGAEGSDVHKQRFARWWKHVRMMKKVGYWVFTVPEALRDKFRTQAKLREATDFIMSALKELGFDHGRDRWHWSGEQSPGVFAPHDNVLTESGYLAPSVIRAAKIAWASYLGIVDYRKVDVHYQFVDPERVGTLKGRDLMEFGFGPGVPVPPEEYKRIWKEVCTRRVIHRVKYVTRPTFPMEAQTFLRESLILLLRNYRNDHWWGPDRWGKEEVWTLRDGEEGAMHSLVEGKCPHCDSELRWQRVPKAALAGLKLRPCGGGYFKVVEDPGQVDPVAEYLGLSPHARKHGELAG